MIVKDSKIVLTRDTPLMEEQVSIEKQFKDFKQYLNATENVDKIKPKGEENFLDALSEALEQLNIIKA